MSDMKIYIIQIGLSTGETEVKKFPSLKIAGKNVASVFRTWAKNTNFYSCRNIRIFEEKF